MQIIDLLGGLIDKSLVQFEPASGAEPHYRMLVTVRQYAAERLAESGAGDALRERHLDYFLSLGLQAEPHLRTPQAKSWMNRLDQELDNLHQALAYRANDTSTAILRFDHQRFAPGGWSLLVLVGAQPSNGGHRLVGTVVA